MISKVTVEHDNGARCEYELVKHVHTTPGHVELSVYDSEFDECVLKTCAHVVRVEVAHGH